MSIFGRKEIAKLKKELETSDKKISILESEVVQLNEKCSRYLSELNQANKEIKKYRAEQSPLNTTMPNAVNEELARLKEKNVICENRLRDANKKVKKANQIIYKYQARMEYWENEYNCLLNSINNFIDDEEIHNDCGKDTLKAKDPIYEIVDRVRADPKLMSSVYSSKNDFFSPYEYKMYNLLENLLYNYSFEFGDLAVFSKMRLADIVRLHEETYSSGGNSFCKNVEKYPCKKGLCDLVEKYMPYFSDEDYKRAFLFPLFRLHTDFLICDHNEGTSKPILAIELHGKEHDRNSANPDWNRIHNDNFKKILFDSQNGAMGVRMLVIKNEELDDEEKLIDKIYNTIANCLDCGWIDGISPATLDIVAGKKWNGKIYGGKGQKRVFVNDDQITITDEQAKELEYYISKKRCKVDIL